MLPPSFLVQTVIITEIKTQTNSLVTFFLIYYKVKSKTILTKEEQNMKNQTLLVLSLPFLLASCSSYFKRKDCETKNWFEYGYQVAMQGKRLNSDQYLSECRKAEAEIQEQQLDLGFKSGMSNYCKPDIVFASGKKGQFFNSEFCDPGQIKDLTLKHKDGVLLFCEPNSGYTFGSSGGVYNQICPKEKEEPFVKEYRKGRKKYLNASINENQKRIQQIDYELNSANLRKIGIENEIRLVETIQIVKPGNANPGSDQIDPTESKKRDLKSKLNQYDSEIINLEAQKRKFKEQIYSMEKEVISLD